MKRGPFGTEDDFGVPPPAKLARSEEPKRGVLAASELVSVAYLASPCLFTPQATSTPSMRGGSVQGKLQLDPRAHTVGLYDAVPVVLVPVICHVLLM